MPTTTTYFVYWDPKGAPAFPAGYESGIKAFFKGLEHDNGTDQNFYSVLTQYGVKYETHFGKAITDKDPYPAEEAAACAEPSSRPCISLVQIKAELRGLVKEHKLPGQVFEHDQLPAGEGPTHSYFVLLPPGVSTCDSTYKYVDESGGEQTHVSVGCSDKQYCSLHDFVIDLHELAESVAYAVLPYLTSAAGCEDPQHPNGISDGELQVVEHEFAEMITDPYATGWVNSPTVGEEEVADICQDGESAYGNIPFYEKMLWGTPLGTAANGALYNQVIDGRDYYLQQVYSNETETCVQRKALPPVVAKLAPTKGPLAGNKKVKITGLNFENPTVTSVDFGKVPATSFTVASPTSIKAVSPAGEAAGPVEVTVTTSAGTSAKVAADQFTYEA